MYLTYCIHIQTNNLTPLTTYNTKKEAWDGLKSDAQQFLNDYKGCATLTTISKPTELDTVPDGFYYKISTKYPNRGSIYERTTQEVKGFFYNTRKATSQKIFIFSIMEFPLTHSRSTTHANTDSINPIPINKTKRAMASVQVPAHVQVIEELKTFLDKRRIAVEGSSHKSNKEDDKNYKEKMD